MVVHQDAGSEITGLLPELRSSPRNCLLLLWLETWGFAEEMGLLGAQSGS